MKVLFAAAEAVPFAKTGGLGDVIGSLPRTLKESRLDVRVIMPFYKTIPCEYRKAAADLGAITVPVSWRRQYCGLKSLGYENLTFYFLDNEYYYNRTSSMATATMRNASLFFSRAVLEALPHLGFQPDILHCHDWHTGPISVFIREFYRNASFYKNVKTILTIHNIAYQGNFSYEILGDVLGLADGYYTDDSLKLNSGISYLKGGMAFTDAITTVSKTYAQEILTPRLGEGLHKFLAGKKGKLKGIVNGIDYDEYNPMTDPAIAIHYRYSLKKKRENKCLLQQELGLARNKETCLAALVSRLAEQKGIDLLLAVLPALLEKGIQVVILGTGDPSYEKALQKMAKKHRENLAVRIGFDENMARRIYAGSDLFFMPSLKEPCGLGQLIALRYGSIPVVHQTGGLQDTVFPYKADTAHGNGFSFSKYTAGGFLAAVQEALGIYQQEKEWNKIFKNAVNSNYGWANSAREYADLYRALLGTQ